MKTTWWLKKQCIKNKHKGGKMDLNWMNIQNFHNQMDLDYINNLQEFK